MPGREQEIAPAVPARATQGAEARDWSWVEASVWTDRMVSALENGVKGGRWYSLMDKVFAPTTLEAAWEKVLVNDGAGDALREVAQLIADGYTFVVDADFESYFDSIPHERLMRRVEERVSDGRILGLLRAVSFVHIPKRIVGIADAETARDCKNHNIILPAQQ